MGSRSAVTFTPFTRSMPRLPGDRNRGRRACSGIRPLGPPYPSPASGAACAKAEIFPVRTDPGFAWITGGFRTRTGLKANIFAPRQCFRFSVPFARITVGGFRGWRRALLRTIRFTRDHGFRWALWFRATSHHRARAAPLGRMFGVDWERHDGDSTLRSSAARSGSGFPSVRRPAGDHPGDPS